MTVSELKPGVVCRSTQGERIPGDRPQTPFQAEVATFDRVEAEGPGLLFQSWGIFHGATVQRTEF